MTTTIYDYNVKQNDGKEINLSKFKGNVLLIVNTASRCGYTPQFEGLQSLFKKYERKGFKVLGFPCNQFASQDPGTDKEIKSFCSLNFGVTFPLFSKIEVNGENTHPLYKHLKKKGRGFLSNEIKWNFTKFLIDRSGKVVRRFSPATNPEKIEKHIAKLL